MRYISTRGKAPELGFEDALLAGLARDGGLYVPEQWPTLDQDLIRSFAFKSYQEVAFHVMEPFVRGAISENVFVDLINDAYAGFNHPAVAPLVQIGPNDWILELFHGPTLAFKDFAMQVLARLMDRALKARGQRATIVGATSGDTGGAAIEAFRGCEVIDIFILHPHGRVSDVQRLQMTTASEENVYNIALEGTFDDCQAILKDLFNNLEFRDKVSLAGVNSINWGRIMAQIVYYFSAASSLGSPEKSVSFSVPTGNFGDIFAGYVAKQMGLNIDKLVIATNVNDILARTVKTGTYEKNEVHATQSPSMDIQVSSNFERLLFELSARNAERVCELMDRFKSNGTFTLSETELSQLRDSFSGIRIDEEQTKEITGSLYKSSGYVSDPHTAVGLGAAETLKGNKTENITLSTAHPAKFPDTVEKIVGFPPSQPKQLTEKLQAEEHYTVMENNINLIENFILEHTRAI